MIYRAKDKENNFKYGYKLIVPQQPFTSPPVGSEPQEPTLINYIMPSDTEEYRDVEDYSTLAVEVVEPFQTNIGTAGKNKVELYEGDIITATIYPFENFNGLIVWNDSKKSYMCEYRKKPTYMGKSIFNGMQIQLEYLANANIDVIGNNIDNTDLL